MVKCNKQSGFTRDCDSCDHDTPHDPVKTWEGMDCREDCGQYVPCAISSVGRPKCEEVMVQCDGSGTGDYCRKCPHSEPHEAKPVAQGLVCTDYADCCQYDESGKFIPFDVVCTEVTNVGTR